WRGLRAHELVGLDAGPLHALREVLHARRRRGDDVRFDLEAHGGHPDRIADTFLTVDDVTARDHVEDLARIRDRDRAGGLDRAHRVVAVDVVARAGDGDHAARVLRAHVAAADPDEGGPDLQSREPLRRVDRARHRLHRPIDVDDHAFAKAVGRRLTDADDVDATA